MSTNYTPQTWADGSGGGTPLSAARMQHIEDGIEAVDNASGGTGIVEQTDPPSSPSVGDLWIDTNDPGPTGASGAGTRRLLKFSVAFDDVLVGAQNQIITLDITGAPSGGTFTITSDFGPTGEIAFDADVAALQTAIDGTTGPDIIVVAGANPNFTLELVYRGYTGITLPTLDTNSLTGGSSPSIAIAQTQPYGATVPGKVLFTPPVDDVVLDAWPIVTTPWDGTIAGDLGPWVDDAIVDGLFAVLCNGGAMRMEAGGQLQQGVTTKWDGVKADTGGGSLASAAVTSGQNGGWAAAIVESVPWAVVLSGVDETNLPTQGQADIYVEVATPGTAY